MTEIASLEIKIGAESTSAASHINKLVDSLENLRNSVSGIGNVGSAFSGLAEGLKRLSGVGDIKLPSGLARGIEALKNATAGLGESGNGLNSFANAMSSLSNIKGASIPKSLPDRFRSITETAKTITSEDIANIDAMASSMQKLAGVDLGGFASTIRAAKGKAVTITQTETPVPKESLDASAGEMRGIREAADDAGSAVRKTTGEVKSFDKAGKKAAGTAKELKGSLLDFTNKWISALGRVAFYRLIRSAIKAVTDGFREGISNLYQYSQLVGTEFAPAMDTLATSSLYLKNSLGALSAPLIEALAPAIDYLVDKLVDFLNLIGKAIAVLSGKNTYSQAVKTAAKWGDDLGDAMGSAANSAKELKRYLIGIDELNVIPDQTGSTRGRGSGATGNNNGLMFEEVSVGDYGLTDALDWLGNIAGRIGDFLILAGKWKLGGVLEIFNGISDIIHAVKDMSDNGINWGNISELLTGLSEVAIGIGAFTGNLKLLGAGFAAKGFIGLIDDIKSIIEAGKTGDWSSVDWISFAIHAVELIGGLIVAFGVLSKLKGIAGAAGAAEGVRAAAKATGDVSVATGTLSPKLTSLAKNLGLGVAIIAEVAVAAALVVGAVWVLGKELEQVGIAWEPVIDNAATVAIAIGAGTVLLAGIGAVTYALGAVGTSMIVNMALGVAVLAEVGAATGLLIAEIWAIGKGLDEVGQAWQPVIGNGKTIEKGIELGTALLVGVGVVTAALGAATVASAGLLPVAIGLGTALLVELSAATVLFINSITDVANQLNNELSPVLEELDGNLPSLNDNMSDFVGFMESFAGYVADYSKSSVVSGIAATIDTIVGWFTTDPLEKLYGDVEKTYTQASTLNEKLDSANPALETATASLTRYTESLASVEGIMSGVDFSGLSDSVKTFVGWFDNKPLDKLKDNAKDNATHAGKLNGKLEDANPELETTVGLLTNYTGFLADIAELTGTADYSSLSNGVFISLQGVGSSLITGLISGIQSMSGQLETESEQSASLISTKFVSVSNSAPGWGENIITGVITGTQSMSGQLSTAISQSVSSISEPFISLSNSAYSWGSSMCSSFANGIYGSSYYVTQAAYSLANSVSGAISSVGSSAYRWGQDLASNMANGIWNNIHVVTNAASNLASSVRSYLHFSVPDKGPLADSESYMPDFLELLASGIVKNKGIVVDAVSELSASMSDEMKGIDVSDDVSFKVNRNMSSSYEADYSESREGIEDGVRAANEDLIEAFLTGVQQIIQAINEKDVDISLNGRMLGGSATKEQNRQNRMYGRSLSNA